MNTNNYTLGRGKVHFGRFRDGTRLPDGLRYIGNTPELNLTIETEELDHFSSDYGIREKDDSVSLEVNRTGSLITDNIDPENVALFFFGERQSLVQAASASESDTFEAAIPGLSYQLGVSETNLTGYSGVENVTVTADPDGAATVLTVDVDYKLHANLGMIEMLSSANWNSGDDIGVAYDVRSSTRDRVISGSAAVEGYMLYEAKNPKGKQFNYRMPHIRVSPNGDFALKGDEWQQLPLSIEILKPTTGDAIYMDGEPVFA